PRRGARPCEPPSRTTQRRRQLRRSRDVDTLSSPGRGARDRGEAREMVEGSPGADVCCTPLIAARERTLPRSELGIDQTPTSLPHRPCIARKRRRKYSLLRLDSHGATLCGMADIFISYTSSDRDWAFWIAKELEALGHTHQVHEWEIKGGDDICAWTTSIC